MPSDSALTNQLSSYSPCLLFLRSSHVLINHLHLSLHACLILLVCAAARGPLDLDKPARYRSISPDGYDAPPSASSHRENPSDYSVKEDKKLSRYPRQDPVAPRSHGRYPEHHPEAEVGRSRHADPHLEHQPPSKGKSGDRYQSYEPVETGRPRASWEEEPERAVRRKEKPSRPPPPHSPVDRERTRDRQRREYRDPEWEQRYGREERRDREFRDRPRERDRDRERERARARSRDRGLDEEERGHGRERPRDGRGSWEEEREDGRERRAARGRHRVHSGPGDVFEEEQRRDDARERQNWDGGEGLSPSRRHFDSHLMEETGTAESPHPPAPAAPAAPAPPLSGLCGGVGVVSLELLEKISGGGFGLTIKPLIKKRVTSSELICVASSG